MDDVQVRSFEPLSRNGVIHLMTLAMQDTKPTENSINSLTLLDIDIFNLTSTMTGTESSAKSRTMWMTFKGIPYCSARVQCDGVLSGFPKPRRPHCFNGLSRHLKHWTKITAMMYEEIRPSMTV